MLSHAVFFYYYYSRCKHPLSPNLVPRAFPSKKTPHPFLREKPWRRGCFSPGVFFLELACGRLEVVGERENGRVRGRHARGEGAPSPLACLFLARPFFLVFTTSKRLLRRLFYYIFVEGMYFCITGTLMGGFRQNNSGIVLVDKHTRKQFCMRVVYISLTGSRGVSCE